MGFNKQNVNLQLHDDARFSVGFCFSLHDLVVHSLHRRRF